MCASICFAILDGEEGVGAGFVGNGGLIFLHCRHLLYLPLKLTKEPMNVRKERGRGIVRLHIGGVLREPYGDYASRNQFRQHVFGVRLSVGDISLVLCGSASAFALRVQEASLRRERPKSFLLTLDICTH